LPGKFFIMSSKTFCIRRPFDFATVTYTVTLVLLVPTLLKGFLSLHLADGTYDFAVAQRYLSGDRIYQDFDEWRTPLSIYWNAMLLQLLPRSVAVISLATLLSCLIMTGLLTFVVYRETAGSAALTALFFYSTMYMGVYHWPRSSYSWNAVLLSAFAVAVLVNSSAWADDRVRGNALWTFSLIGLLLGTAVGVKQNIGIWMIVAFLGWTVSRGVLSIDFSLRRMACQAFALAFGACVVPAALVVGFYLQGSLGDFIKIFTEKPKLYLEQMSIPYFGDAPIPQSVRSLPNWVLERLVLVLLLGGFLVSVLCVVVLLSRRWTGPKGALGWCTAENVDSRLGFWAILYIASFLSIFPSADYFHVAMGLPLCLAPLCVFLGRVSGPASAPWVRHLVRRISTGACLVYSSAMLVALANFTFQFVAGNMVLVREFPAQGMIATSETVTFIAKVREAVIRNVQSDDRLLIAHPYACFLYPFLGLRNPTPFEYFHYGVLSRPQILSVVSALDAGEIKALLIEAPGSGSNPFQVLYGYATRKMELRATINLANGFHLFVRR